MSGDNNWWRSLGQSYIHYTVNIPSKRGALNNGLKYPPAALYQLLSGSNHHIRAVDRYVLKIMNHIFEFKKPLLWMVYSASWECRVFMSRWNTHLRLLKLKKVIYGKMECLGVLWAYSWLCFITMGKTSISEEGKSTLIATSIQRMVLKTIVAASCRKQSSPNLPTKILVINVMCDWLIYLHMSKKPENAQELDVFYLRPLMGIPANPSIGVQCGLNPQKYADAPCGENKLASTLLIGSWE